MLQPAETSETSAPVKRFRMLSATLIRGYWIDYSDPGLWTPETVSLFEGTTLYMDHNKPVAEWIGVTANAALSTSTGILGVDADFHIDPTQDDMLAGGAIRRGLALQPTPAIRACSVGIHFDAIPSHGMNAGDWKFWDLLGSELDGEIVRFICKKILRIVECSLVYAGADPGAHSLSASADAQAWIDLSRNAAEVEQMDPLLAKAIKDVTGVDPGQAAAPALYAVKDDRDKLQVEVTALRSEVAALSASERESLIKVGTGNGSITPAMLQPIRDAEGKELAPAYVHSLSLPALRALTSAPKKQHNAAAQQDLSAPDGKITPIPGSDPGEAARLIAQRFGKPVSQVVAEAAEYSAGLSHGQNPIPLARS